MTSHSGQSAQGLGVFVGSRAKRIPVSIAPIRQRFEDVGAGGEVFGQLPPVASMAPRRPLRRRGSFRARGNDRPARAAALSASLG